MLQLQLSQRCLKQQQQQQQQQQQLIPSKFRKGEEERGIAKKEKKN